MVSLAKQSPNQGMTAVCSKQGAKESGSGWRLAADKLEAVRPSEPGRPGTGFPQE